MEIYLQYIKNKLSNNFDVKYRDIIVAGTKTSLIFIDDMCDSKTISEFIIQPLLDYKGTIASMDEVKEKILHSNNLGDVTTPEDALSHILSGDVVIIMESFSKAVFCEAKGFAKRNITIPETEAVLKGPREGFSESLTDNIALIRRRIRNPNLKFENIVMGEQSQTLVVISYIESIVDERVLQYVKNRLNSINYDFVLDTNYVDSVLKSGETIFDVIGHSEKPDKIASKLMEGRVAVIMDGTPNVVTVPYFFVENFQTGDDYYINRYYANVSRGIRWSAFFIATFLTAAYIAITTHHFSLIPTVFVFRLAVSRAGVPFPTTIEVLLMFLFFQLIKEAGIRLPQPIGQAMSIVGALILGDAAVGAGITSQATVLIVALSSICYFLIPKLYGGITIWSLILILFGSFNGFPGVYIGFFMLVTHLSGLKTCNYPYLYPLGTNKKIRLKDTIIRRKLSTISREILKRNEKK
ncbi:spore germination protein [Clostridium thermarum]|uniref:spore germination protein n=1 Tax=Clostridium thermarum TaxID=1716543 RepID=UPI0013D1B075|nr:spore germination protein [Clostridium thermarum]